MFLALTQAQAVATFADTKAYWFLGASAFEKSQLAPAGWSAEGKHVNLEQHGVLQGKIGMKRYYMKVSDSDVISDAQIITPESHIALAETVVEVWPMVQGRPVRPALLAAHFESLGLVATTLLLEELNPLVKSAFPGDSLGKVLPTSGEEMARSFVSLYNQNKIKLPLSALSDEPLGSGTGSGFIAHLGLEFEEHAVRDYSCQAFEGNFRDMKVAINHLTNRRSNTVGP